MLLYIMQGTVLQIDNFLPDKEIRHGQRREMVEQMLDFYTLENDRKAVLMDL